VNLRGAIWRKSTRSSGGGNGDCVEVAITEKIVGVRDSKSLAGEVLTFSPAAWRSFMEGCKAQIPNR
jgi:hypothetical protein